MLDWLKAFSDALPLWVYTFITAECVFVLARTEDFGIVIKKRRQLTAEEKARVDRGLMRSLVWDSLVNVPVSAVVALLLVQLVLPKTGDWSLAEPPISSKYSALGLVSYGFPFLSVKELVLAWVLRKFGAFFETNTSGGQQRAPSEVDRGVLPPPPKSGTKERAKELPVERPKELPNAHEEHT
jgi:hypothetical protein